MKIGPLDQQTIKQLENQLREQEERNQARTVERNHKRVSRPHSPRQLTVTADGEPIIDWEIPQVQAIIALLDEGLDSYHISYQLGVSAWDVANAERQRVGLRSRIYPADTPPIIDEQETGDSRLLMFPPLEDSDVV